MTSLTPEQIEFLQRYGFDELLFEHWRRGLAEGRISRARNVVEGALMPPPEDTVHELPKRGSDRRSALEAMGRGAIAAGELGVVVLNGGMATRFGGVVKGVVEVLGPGRTFLALKAEDVRRAQDQIGGRIHLLVMNSFATDEATRAHFEQRGFFGLDPEQVLFFNQNASARLRPDGDIFVGSDGGISPYSTGHGDFAPCLRRSGTLQRFLDAGGRTLMVSNVDNLAARVHPAIVGHHLVHRAEATVEVAPKWPGDVGGSPWLYEDRVQLIEQIRYPDGFDADVVGVFNTNTFHFAAKALDRDFDLGFYYAEKDVDGERVVQMERLIGELTRHLRSVYLKVKRSGRDNRFLPMKTPDDLAAAREEIAAMYPS